MVPASMAPQHAAAKSTKKVSRDAISSTSGPALPHSLAVTALEEIKEPPVLFSAGSGLPGSVAWPVSEKSGARDAVSLPTRYAGNR